ncbi:hypothetical protein GY45DRAFT_1348437 [Cubamyces sp. BRFM 1775]|nr:hypothetical protein GY45DRAFT_1348437 [Cubamyces sp. BRFM 1775]
MPPCGHATAPTFDPANPRNLRCFFLDVEALFERSGVEDEQQKKVWVVRYLPMEVAELCESLPAYSGEGHSYQQFKTAVIALYPGAGDDRKFSMAEVEALVTQRAKSPITNVVELSSYYRDFYTMTTYLIVQGQCSKSEQSHLFVRGIAEPLWERIQKRLELKDPDHYPDDPYDVDKVYEAATFILHGTIIGGKVPSQSASTATQPPPTTLKMEDLAPILEGSANAAAHTANRFAGPPPGAPRYQPNFAPQEQRYPPPGGNFCHYCGNPGCQLRSCPFVEEDVRAGRCMRNQEGRVVLPNGNFTPRQLPGFDGITMRDWLYEWHRRSNANAPTPAAQMVLSIVPDEPSASTFQLSAEDRIAQLEYEILALQQGRRMRFDSVEVPQPRKARPRQSSPSAQARGRSQEPWTFTDRQAPPHLPPTFPIQEQPAEPEHPFAKARDATYAPPRVRNFGAPAPRGKSGDREPAYRTRAPIQQEEVVKSLFQRSMTTPYLTVSMEELLSILPELRSQFREKITPRRVAAETRTVAFAEADEVVEDAANGVCCSGKPLEPDGVIVPDPYEVYLRDLAPSREATELSVAKESHALRSIVGLVDNKEYVEVIVDPGCMIIAMSEHVCHALSLAYDPSIRLNMVSVNGETDKSLGLVRNVPFRVTDIILYLQVHIIHNAAYDILLGRPFNVLTKSAVKNFENEDQTITIQCPNTGQVATIPTVPRGRARFRAEQDA